jgi:probable F420-dependent oxidoreductase
VAGAWAGPEALAAVARRAESLGYASLWVFQRLLRPLAPRNEYYGTPGGPWPEAFGQVLDPLTTLAYVAAHTARIRLGVSVLITPFYSPVVLAKSLATLDVLSGGRLDVGLGLGWSEDEYEATGAAWRGRGARGEEFVRALKAAWTAPEAGFAGAHFRFPPSQVGPPPAQRPHPPLLLGGYHPAVFRRVAAHADGYTGGNVPFAEMATVVARVRTAAEAAGRDPDRLRIVCRGAYALGAAPGGTARRPLRGTVEEVRADLRRYAAAGVTEMFLDPNFQPGGGTLARVLDDLQALAPPL